MPEPLLLDCPDGETIAYYTHTVHGRNAKKTGIVWLGGLKSDMTGTKATALHEWAEKNDRAYVRFDYFGHGRSSGQFVDGTISRWSADAQLILERVATGPQVLVASSMGGWAAILATLARPDQIEGIVFIAPAPDFTEDLMWAQFSDETRALIERGEIYRQPSMYDDNPYLISPGLIEDGRRNLVLRRSIDIDCPVRILHGMSDTDVPWARSVMLIDALCSKDVVATFVKNADHRFSDEPEIARLLDTVGSLCEQVD